MEFLDYPVTKKQIKAAGPGDLRIGRFNPDAFGQYLIKKTVSIAANSTGRLTLPIKTQGTTYLSAIGHSWQENSLFQFSAPPISWRQTNGQIASLNEPFYFNPGIKVRDTISLNVTNNNGTAKTYELLLYIQSAGCDYEDETENTGAQQPTDYSSRIQPFVKTFTTPGFVTLHNKTFSIWEPGNGNYLIIFGIETEMLQKESSSPYVIDGFYKLDGNTFYPTTAQFNNGVIDYKIFEPYKFGTLDADLTVKYVQTESSKRWTMKTTVWGWEISG